MAFHIPTVTADNLLRFHLTHFPGLSLPKSFFVAEITENCEPPAEEDYGLGYYYDGVPRTLTNDQVTMFRHSEIESHLRERRHRLEAEAEAAEVAGTQSPEMAIVASTQAITEVSTEAATVDLSDGAIPSETMGDTESTRKKAKKNKGKKKKPMQKQKHQQQKDWQRLTQAEEYTPNRMAREQDAVQNASVELDY
jgi:hypothetical protein